MSDQKQSKRGKRGFIDEQGRLFGVLNIIDALVLACLLSLAPALYYGYRLVNQPPPPPAQAPPPPVTEWVTVKGYLQGMIVESLELVSPGDAIGTGENVTFRVLAVGASDLVWHGERNVVSAFQCVQQGDQWVYGGQPMKVGARLVVLLPEWDGVVVVQEYHEGLMDPRDVMPGAATEDGRTWTEGFAEIEVLAQQILPELGNLLKPGDVRHDWAAVATGKILQVEISPDDRAPSMVTVRCRARVAVRIVAGHVWYGRTEVKPGNRFTIETERCSLEGTLVGLRDVST